MICIYSILKNDDDITINDSLIFSEESIDSKKIKNTDLGIFKLSLVKRGYEFPVSVE